MGAPFDGKIRESVIYRLNEAPQQPVRYAYLVVSDEVEAPTDVVTVKDFRKIREKLKKKAKRGTGLEVTIAPTRKLDAAGVARWFDDVTDLYSFCHSSGCQLILSSGASSIHEMVSGPSLDAILRNCGIDPETHWREMCSWLEARLSKRVAA